MHLTEWISLGQEKNQVSQLVIVSFLVSLLMGVIGGFIGQGGLAVVSTAVLMGLFGAYNQTFKRDSGVPGGMLAGGLLGFLISLVSLPLSRNISGVWNGALFGLFSGAVIGGVIGIITRAQPDEDDSLFTKLFLVAGSIVLGIVLGAGVGLISGFILGLIISSWSSVVVAALAAGIVGGYIGSYFQKVWPIVTGAFLFAVVAVLSIWINNSLAGLVLGLISGTFAPMLIVALIGAYGGLFSRGLKAMVVEAIEAPAEMLLQGAVPSLVPAMMVGMMVGTAASGIGGLIVLPISLALVGLVLAIMGEIEGRPKNEITIRAVVEMTMMGAGDWPLDRVIKQIVGSKHRKEAVIGALLGLLISVTSCMVGVYLGGRLSQLW